MKRFACFALVSLLAACPGDSDNSDSDSDETDTTSIDAGDDAPDSDTPGCDDGETRCADDSTLETCVAGEFQASACPGEQECRAQGDGFACLDPVLPGQFTVTGKVQYEDREPRTAPGNGGLAAPLGPLTPQPARFVTVAVIKDQGSTVIATGFTANDGSYTLAYSAAAGTQVHVLASTVNNTAAHPWTVTKEFNGGNSAIHGFGGASFAAAESTTSNLLVTEAGGARAFNVFEQMVLGGEAVKARMGVTTLIPLLARWENNGTDGTYYTYDSVGGNDFPAMHLLGGGDGDDDGYDDTVILHEIGHYVEDQYGRSDSQGGPHNGSPTDPKLAWSEGFSTYFASAVRNNFFYMDSNDGGGFAQDIDGELTKANGAGNQNQNVAEGMISEILWDVGDAPAGDDDARSGAEMHTEVLKVQPGFLAGGTGSKGVAGVDLVDWFHGFVSVNGTAACAGLKAIATQHTFPVTNFGCP